MKLIEILAWLRANAPEDTAMAGDPVGLQIHPIERDVEHVGICLDATPAIASAAALHGAELLVCHHPLIYRPLTRILADEPLGRAATTLIREGIALYVMHTNWDAAKGGINDTLAHVLGLSGVRPLAAAGDAQLARIGEICPEPFHKFTARIGRVLDTTGESALRFSPEFSDCVVKSIAVCGGAGAFLLPDAIAAEADAFVTSDVRHHEFVDAAGRDTILIDAGHGATERPGMAALAHRMHEQFPNLKVSFLG